MKGTLARFALIVFLALACTAHPCPDGIAWDAGGYRSGQVFLCPASGHMEGQTWVRDWTNPLAPLFPELVQDC